MASCSPLPLAPFEPACPAGPQASKPWSPWASRPQSLQSLKALGAEGLERCVGMAWPGWRGGGAKDPPGVKKSKIPTFLSLFAFWAPKVQKCIYAPENWLFLFLGSEITKIPLRLQAFLHGGPKNQNLLIFSKKALKLLFTAPKRKKCISGSKMLPGPLGPHLWRGKLEANSRIGRYIFEIFMLESIFDEKLIFYHFYFWKWILQFVFVQKIIIPPLRTKRYYSKPKWRSRRHKSLKMRKNTTFHLFTPKSHFCSRSAFWGHF